MTDQPCECWPAHHRPGCKHRSHQPSTPAPSGAYSVECWRCGARTDTTHDAHCPDRPAPSGGGTPTAVEALERLLETAVENDDHEGYSAGYIFGLETAIAALVQDKAPIDVDRLNREHPLD
jgi:hypothetical protein